MAYLTAAAYPALKILSSDLIRYDEKKPNECLRVTTRYKNPRIFSPDYKLTFDVQMVGIRHALLPTNKYRIRCQNKNRENRNCIYYWFGFLKTKKGGLPLLFSTSFFIESFITVNKISDFFMLIQFI